MVQPAPAFDRNELLDVLGGDTAVFAELIGLYLAEAPKLREAVWSAARPGDAVGLRKAAHALKGTLVNLAAHDAHAAAQAVEALARAGDLSAVPAALAVLATQLDRLHAELESENRS